MIFSDKWRLFFSVIWRPQMSWEPPGLPHVQRSEVLKLLQRVIWRVPVN